jgi:hypothetical protein
MKATAKVTLKALSKFITMIGVALFVASCARDGVDPNRNNVFANCSNCGTITNGQTFFQSQSSDTMYGMIVNLSFIGSSNTYIPYNNQYGQMQQQPFNQQNNGMLNPIVNYAGTVAAQGQLVLSQPIGSYSPQYGQQYGSCFVPAGTYSVATAQAGQWQNAIVTGLVLTATGPASLIINISQAQVAAKSPTGATWNEVAPVGRLFGNFMIQSINGMNCNINTFIQ